MSNSVTPFDGIDEKLKRANENIKNLDSEIVAFFNSGKYSVLPDNDRQAHLEAVAYHKNRIIPPRFSVLAGEVIHHLRSILDHIAWFFSDPAIREAHRREIEFPIVKSRPVKKRDIARYEGKIQGINDVRVRALIEMLQPYNSTDPEGAPLLIIQDMDIRDKHRELILCIGTGAKRIPAEIGKRVVSYQRGDIVNILPADLAAELKRNTQMVPQVSFANFVRREIQPIVPGLIDLLNYVVYVVKAFDDLR
jgi:hypothetical protein